MDSAHKYFSQCTSYLRPKPLCLARRQIMAEGDLEIGSICPTDCVLWEMVSPDGNLEDA
jgi:hypothetical protein